MNKMAFPAALLLGLGGCMAVPITSLPALSRIDFPTTDLAALRVAVRLPEAIRPRPGGVKMDAVKSLEDGSKEQLVFLLVPAEERAGPEDAPRAGEATYLYRLSEVDLSRFEALRSGLLRHKQEGKRGSLGLGVAAQEFCLTGSPAAGPLPVTTYLRTSETRRYVTLTDRLDLRREETMAKALPSLGPC